MANNYQKLTALCLVIIALSSVLLVYKSFQPDYLPVENGRYVDRRSGKIYQPAGQQMVPVMETTNDRLRRQYPDGRYQ